MKVLEMKEGTRKDWMEKKLKVLADNKEVLKEQDGIERMENLLGFNLKLFHQKNEDILSNVLGPDHDINKEIKQIEQ